VAKDVLQEDFLLLESDLLYESRALSTVINYDGPDVVLASGKTRSNDEVYIYGENQEERSEYDEYFSIFGGKIAAISKNPRPHLLIQGELVGISKISHNLFRLMCAQHEENLTFPCSNHYEECISEVSSKQMVPFLRVSDLVWTEIDNQFHYDRAIKKIYPRIIQQETIKREGK
jgi:2-aminoethylphosphonate-pyruvate transaminase